MQKQGQPQVVNNTQEFQVPRIPHYIFAAIELAIILTAVILEVVAISVRPWFFPILATGIWFGLVLLLPALFGFVAACRNSRCCLVTCMVFAIIFAAFAVIPFVFFVIELLVAEVILQAYDLYSKFKDIIEDAIKNGNSNLELVLQQNNYTLNTNQVSDNVQKVSTEVLKYLSLLANVCVDCLKFMKIKNIIGMLLGLVAFIVTIIQSAFCCKDVCGCCKSNEPPQQQIPMQNQGQGQENYAYQPHVQA